MESPVTSAEAAASPVSLPIHSAEVRNGYVSPVAAGDDGEVTGTVRSTKHGSINSVEDAAGVAKDVAAGEFNGTIMHAAGEMTSREAETAAEDNAEIQQDMQQPSTRKDSDMDNQKEKEHDANGDKYTHQSKRKDRDREGSHGKEREKRRRRSPTRSRSPKCRSRDKSSRRSSSPRRSKSRSPRRRDRSRSRSLRRTSTRAGHSPLRRRSRSCSRRRSHSPSKRSRSRSRTPPRYRSSFVYGSRSERGRIPPCVDMVNLLPSVKRSLVQLYERGLLMFTDLDVTCLDVLKSLTEREGLQALDDLAHINFAKVRNLPAFFVGICRKISQASALPSMHGWGRDRGRERSRERERGKPRDRYRDSYKDRDRRAASPSSSADYDQRSKRNRRDSPSRVDSRDSRRDWWRDNDAPESRRSEHTSSWVPPTDEPHLASPTQRASPAPRTQVTAQNSTYTTGPSGSTAVHAPHNAEDLAKITQQPQPPNVRAQSLLLSLTTKVPDSQQHSNTSLPPPPPVSPVTPLPEHTAANVVPTTSIKTELPLPPPPPLPLPPSVQSSGPSDTMKTSSAPANPLTDSLVPPHLVGHIPRSTATAGTSTNSNAQPFNVPVIKEEPAHTMPQMKEEPAYSTGLNSPTMGSSHAVLNHTRSDKHFSSHSTHGNNSVPGHASHSHHDPHRFSNPTGGAVDQAKPQNSSWQSDNMRPQPVSNSYRTDPAAYSHHPHSELASRSQAGSSAPHSYCDQNDHHQTGPLASGHGQHQTLPPRDGRHAPIIVHTTVANPRSSSHLAAVPHSQAASASHSTHHTLGSVYLASADSLDRYYSSSGLQQVRITTSDMYNSAPIMVLNSTPSSTVGVVAASHSAVSRRVNLHAQVPIVDNLDRARLHVDGHDGLQTQHDSRYTSISTLSSSQTIDRLLDPRMNVASQPLRAPSLSLPSAWSPVPDASAGGPATNSNTTHSGPSSAPYYTNSFLPTSQPQSQMLSNHKPQQQYSTHPHHLSGPRDMHPYAPTEGSNILHAATISHMHSAPVDAYKQTANHLHPGASTSALLGSAGSGPMPLIPGPQATPGSGPDAHQQPSSMMRVAVMEFVKELMKPAWKSQRLSREDFKTIARKAVDKVLLTVPKGMVVDSAAAVQEFLSESRKEKIKRLVDGYLHKYNMTNTAVMNGQMEAGQPMMAASAMAM